MAFSPEQIADLKAPLSSEVVKEREQAGRKFSYIEAYHAENEANRIFGFDAWDRETELTLLGEPRLAGDKWRVGYRAKVRITVRTPDGGVVVREGCGFGSGIDKDVDQAHESALKEAESDAEKRALKTFGNPFGQALYDKTKSEVAAPEPIVSAATRYLNNLQASVDKIMTVDDLAAYFKSSEAEMDAMLSGDDRKRANSIFNKRKAALTPTPREAVNA